MNTETYIAVVLENHADVAWLNECYEMVRAEEMLPVQEVPHNAFRSKTPSYVGIKLVAAKQLPKFEMPYFPDVQPDPQYHTILTATQPILDLFVTNLKEKLQVVRWPWKLVMVEAEK